MSIEARRLRAWLVALLAGALSVALTAGDAAAKFSCDDRGRQPEGIAVRGLPANPVAERDYTLAVTLRTGYGANPSPYLGAQHCGDAIEPEDAPGFGGQLKRVGANGSRVFTLDLRFPEPGPWALSFMDLDGTFYDFGLRQVSSRRTGVEPAPAAAAGGSAPTTWLISGAALALAAALAFSVRRWRRG
jgi:hypothetical protein